MKARSLRYVAPSFLHSTFVDALPHRLETLILNAQYNRTDNTIAIMQITIKTKTSTFTLDVEPAEGVADVTAKIQDHEGIPPHQQRLNFGSVRSEEGRTLSDRNFVEGS